MRGDQLIFVCVYKIKYLDVIIIQLCLAEINEYEGIMYNALYIAELLLRLIFFHHLFYDENSYRKLDVVYKQPLVAAPTAHQVSLVFFS